MTAKNSIGLAALWLPSDLCVLFYILHTKTSPKEFQATKQTNTHTHPKVMNSPFRR